jgi:hypothetical protein
MREIKLIKEVVLGKFNFKLSVNRAIFIDVNKKFPEFFKKAFEMSNSGLTPELALANGKVDELFDLLDFSKEQAKKITEYALPMLLKEAGSKENPIEIIDYAKENDVFELLANGVVEFILTVFTKGEQAKPKVKFSMK